MASSAPRLPRADLYLVDTMGYIFRAFHALPPMTNAAGLPSQAVLGVVNMLRKLRQDAQPPALAAVFDLAGPTFRDEKFAAYKATRAAMPDTLVPQLPYIRRALEALRVPMLEAAGFEADDVLGTMARLAAAAGHQVVIVSSDKDLLQLVGPQVRVYNPGRDVVYGPAEVEQTLGVRPDQVADLLALRGDDVDNIPGAPGIGEKGACQLVQRFGSVEAALERAAEVERKTYRESLQQHREQILLSKELATIHTAVPLAYTPEAWQTRDPDLEACRSLFTELEFHHVLAGLGLSPEAAVPATEVIAADAAALGRLLHGGEAVALVVDAHTAALAGGAEGRLLAGVVGAEAAPELVTALAEQARPWQWADSKQVGAALAARGWPRPELDAERVSDVTLLAYLADSTRGDYDLAAVLPRLGLPAAADPAAQAAAIALAAPRLRQAAESSGQLAVYRELDLPLIPVLEAMETAGVRLDPAPLAVLGRDLEARCAAAQEAVFTHAGQRFNLNSPKQLAEILFDKLGLPAPARRGKTATPSTAQDVLEDLAADPAGEAIVRPILDYRQFSKLKSTYVDALPPLINPFTGRLHTTFNLTGSATGRLSSTDPNLQNIPIRTEVGRSIRAAFVAEPGHLLLAADYSQIELRLLAHFSQDPLLLAAYGSGGDIHRLTAAEVFGVPPEAITGEHRRRAKAVNFGIVYGLSAFGLARQLNIPRHEAGQFIERYFERYAGVKAWTERALEAARREGLVRTLHGRIRPIPNLDARNPTLRGFAERTAINSPLQGTAADLIKLAMIRLHPLSAALGARLLLQVHDELVFEVPAAQVQPLADLVRREMCAVAQLAVPLEVDLGAGPNWRDLDDIASR